MRFWMAFFRYSFQRIGGLFLHMETWYEHHQVVALQVFHLWVASLGVLRKTWGASVEILDLRSAGIGIHADVQGSVFCFRSFVLVGHWFWQQTVAPKKWMIIFLWSWMIFSWSCFFLTNLPCSIFYCFKPGRSGQCECLAGSWSCLPERWRSKYL